MINDYKVLRPGLVSALACLVFVSVGALPPCAAQPANTVPRYTHVDGFPVFNTFSPDRWGIVGVTVTNPTEKPLDLLASHYFDDRPDLQFARQLWIPRHAKRTAWYPVLPAPGQPPTFMHVNALLIDRSMKNEVILKNPQGAMVYNGWLPSSKDEGQITGLITGEKKETDWLAQAARAACKLTPRVHKLRADSFPPTSKCLQSLDQLVIGDDRLSLDSAAIHAIRQWLYGGGKLWIMLDRVPLATVSLLLGEDLDWTIVDRVGLTRWQFQQGHAMAGLSDDGDSSPASAAPRGGRLASNQISGQISLFDPPVEMVKLLATDVKPAYSIDGWPAAFWRRAGRGLVLFTTLGPRGWLTARSAAAGELPVEGKEPLVKLASYFMMSRERPTLPSEAFEPYLAEKVGYRIVSRWKVLAILGTFCLILAASGVWLARNGSLSHLAWIGPGSGLVVALVLITEGNRSRHAIPPTVAEAQWVEVAPGGNDAHVTGLLAFYNQEESSAELGSDRDGIFFPDVQGQAGVMHRMVWTDLNRWHWENMTLSAGLHLAKFSSNARFDRPLSARATFGPDGLVGKIDGSVRGTSDALVAFPSQHNLAVRFVDADGNFAAGPSDQLNRNTFLSSGVLSDEQRRRHALYKRLFERHAVPTNSSKPMLLTWANPLDLGFTFTKDVQRAGSALLAIPLNLDRPKPGTRVLLPAPFLPYRSILKPSRNYALWYDSKNNVWLTARSNAGKTMLRVQLPAELLPLQVEKVVLTVDLNAQARDFEVFVDKDATSEVLATRNSPVGRLRIEIDRTELLQPDAEGCIYLGIALSAAQKLPGEVSASSEWQINDLQLELVGRISEP